MPCLILAPQYKKVIDKPAWVQRRATMVVGCWGTCPVRRGWGISAGSAWRGDGFGGPNSSLPGRVGRRLRQSQHLQGGAWQEEKKAMETDRNQRGSDWTTREDAFIQDSEVVGVGCPEAVQSLSLGALRTWRAKAVSSLVWADPALCRRLD